MHCSQIIPGKRSSSEVEQSHYCVLFGHYMIIKI